MPLFTGNCSTQACAFLEPFMNYTMRRWLGKLRAGVGSLRCVNPYTETASGGICLAMVFLATFSSHV